MFKCVVSFIVLYNISTYSQYIELDLYSVTLLRIFRQIAEIEHYSYAYFRVLFLACDGRSRGYLNNNKPIGLITSA